MYANDKKGLEAGDEYSAHAFRWVSHKRNIELIADFSADWQAQLELARSNHPDYCNLEKFAAFVNNNTMPPHVPKQHKRGRPSSKQNEEADDEEVPEEMAEGSSSSRALSFRFRSMLSDYDATSHAADRDFVCGRARPRYIIE